MSFASRAPSIRIYDPYGPQSPQRHRPSQPLSSSIPMAIPNAREDVPPPLPPPRYISGLDTGQDPGWQWSNNRQEVDLEVPYPPSAKSGSSIAGVLSARHRYSGDEGVPFDAAGSRRSSQMSPTPADAEMQGSEGIEPTDEERNGTSRPSLARLRSETQLGQRALHKSLQAYDKQLLSLIGGPNTPSRTPTSSAPNGFSKFAGTLQPLSVPDHRYPVVGSPRSRWSSSAPSSGISPRTSFRSPVFEHHAHESPYGSRHNSSATLEPYEESVLGGHSTRSSVDQGVFLDPELEENGVRDLSINDRSPPGTDEGGYGIKGIKRRASSPPQDAIREDRASGDSHDLYHKRSVQMLANRSSPATRYPASHGSVSSNSSAGHRSSYASSWNLSIASSITSLGGVGGAAERLSPSAEADLGPVSPYAASLGANHSPRTSLSKTSHQRKLSAEENGTMANSNNNVAKMQPFYVCECCPKKPKKFDTKDELEAHAMEKQYQCQYCPNRFKNKNEAERHQNSLHLRRHSWSCAALAGVQAAFHPSAAHPATADVCGYCGQEFPNPANWDARAEHLCQVHKFGECNQAKKFFRADHFRQHLKHSHAGTSGKWTNMLENACMREEAPPPVVNVGGSPLGPSVNGGVIGDVIDEVHNES